MKEPVFLCQLHAHIYMHIYIFSLLTTGFSNHKSVCLSGKVCLPTLSILISALNISLLKQTITDFPLFSWFLFPFCPSDSKKDHMGNTIRPGKRKYSLKRQSWLKVCLNNTWNDKKKIKNKIRSHSLHNADLPEFLYFKCCYWLSHPFAHLQWHHKTSGSGIVLLTSI